jgi:two-component system sensor histidine kinase HydH
MGMMGHGGWRSVTPQVAMLKQGRAVIHLGLHTREFVDARRQDIQHSLFMGGLLLLLGTAGFYFLFLYQNMVVTRTTLATMKLYTKNIIESMPDGLFTLDSQGRIVSCNPKAMEFTNMDIRSLKGRCPEELFPGWPKTNMLRSGVSSSFSYTFAHEDGNEIPMEVSGSILRDNQGHNLGAVFLLRDLRAVRSMEQQLARSRRLAALGRMAAGIAHEIRNPLGTLRGFAQYFGSQADDEAAREYSALMIGEVDRLNESISSLLQFSRPREPEFNRIEPANLLEKAGRLLEYDLKEKDIILQKSCNCSQPIMADGDLLLQVLLNLLKNALNVSQPGSTVELFCRETRDDVRITVKDNGTGMDRAEREQMFDPFFTTRKSGTGLGLAVSHQIVEQHDGQFEVESGVGRGTAITVILPRRYNPNKDKDKKSRDKA